MKTSETAVDVSSLEYQGLIEDIKAWVHAARTTAARAVNLNLILLYWEIGRGIIGKQQMLGWGESVVEVIAADLRRAFPSSRSFSADNVWRMRQFFLAYDDVSFLGQAVPKSISAQSLLLASRQPVVLGRPVPESHAKSHAVATESTALSLELLATVPWGHHLLILKKIDDIAVRFYYLKATAQFGWTRDVLLNQIKANAYARAVTDPKSHNFALTLPEHLAEQADEMLKSTYSLEFLGLRGAVKERVLEDRLISRLQAFLLELGYGFCFVGRQHRLKLGQKEYFIDLLFYHRHLKALIAFELKVGAFEPEHAGKMDFYLNLLNDLERGEGDQSAIGIILCAEKDDVEVEYALRSKANPIGVATYQLQTTLPPDLQGKLPTAKQLADVVQATLAQGGE
jgi:predicted nuclease of restriction endonuclease-like (RecB) superfamily